MDKKPKKIGLVIGSGGIKTLGVPSFFRFLDEHQLKPDLIIGCSGGSILSTLWASGFSISDLELFVQEYCDLLRNQSLLKQMDIRTLLSIPGYPGGRFEHDSGILKNQWLLDFFKAKVGDKRVEDCLIPTKLLATELETGKPYIIEKGLIAESVYASCAIYPMMPPIKLDGKWLVDGMYHSAVPVLQAVQMGCDKIIALSFEEHKSDEHQSFFEFYMEFVSQVLNKNARKQNAMAVDLHHDEILFVNYHFDRGINFWDVDSMDYIKMTSNTVLENHSQDIIELFAK